ncbi:MAG: LysR family transcriptional regulator [Myxococcota bacterium]
MLDDFDWDTLRVFVAAAEAGSFSGAARALGLSQPTAGRQVQALEAQLGVQLFARTSRGLHLTDIGMSLLEHARTMAAAANRLALVAQGQSESIAGVVRITASEIVATYTLPSVLVALRAAEPEIEIEIVASNATENLLEREADIAVRMYRPTQADVITRSVGAISIGAYAAESYLARRGCPMEPEDLLKHDVVGYDRDDTTIRGFRAAGVEVTRRFFPVRTDDQVLAWHLAVAGYGIGFMQVQIGDAEPKVRRVLPKLALPTLPMWLTAHSELKTNRRIRRVYDFLADALRRQVRPTSVEPTLA